MLAVGMALAGLVFKMKCSLNERVNVKSSEKMRADVNVESVWESDPR